MAALLYLVQGVMGRVLEACVVLPFLPCSLRFPFFPHRASVGVITAVTGSCWLHG